MKRLLVVAHDRALTKFVAEAMLGRPLNAAAPRPDDPWEIARAHTGLEAFLLVSRGGRPYDTIVVDQSLPDQDPLALIARLRETTPAKEVPIFLLTERGRDQHSRRIASEEYRVAGFIEKPVSAESLVSSLDALERKRRILLVESKSEAGLVYRDALERAGYLAELVSSGRDGLDRAPRFRPDVIVAALMLDDMRGIDVCVEVKKSRALKTIPVVLYGQVTALAHQEIAENALRADDFVQAPFDDELLVDRISVLIGRGAEPGRRVRRLSTGMDSGSEPHDGGTIDEVGNRKRPTLEIPPQDEAREAKAQAEAISTPPASASPSPTAPSNRSTRRVPCQISMSIRNDGRVYTSKTLDISHGGIFVETDETLEIGTRLDMTFQIPSTDRVVNAVGKVAWVGRGGGGHKGVGVKFSRIEARDLQLIVDYVNRVARVVFHAT